MQARCQYGNLTARKGKKGPNVWQFRWLENGRLKSVLIGSVEKYPHTSGRGKGSGAPTDKDQLTESTNAVPLAHSGSVDRPIHGIARTETLPKTDSKHLSQSVRRAHKAETGN